jgi:hypothetical protein
MLLRLIATITMFPKQRNTSGAMKLRQAQKICWVVFDRFQCDPKPFKKHHPRWKPSTIEKAIAVCRRHDRGKKPERFRELYIPDEREIEEQDEMMAMILFSLAEDVFGVPTEEVDKMREQFFK